MKNLSFALICFCILAMTVGFSALNSDMNISGEATVRSPQEIRIEDLELSNHSNAYEKYNSSYTKNTIKVLPAFDASGAEISYRFNINNKSDKTYMISNIKTNHHSNENVNFELKAYVQQLIEPNTVWTDSRALVLTSGVDESIDEILELEFEFVEYELAPPVITGGSDLNTWTNQNVISVATAGKASDGIKHYEYYLSATNTAPGADASATGTTNDEVALEDNSTQCVWYRTVSANDHKSGWSNARCAKVDITAPSFDTWLTTFAAYWQGGWTIAEECAAFTSWTILGDLAHGVDMITGCSGIYTASIWPPVEIDRDGPFEFRFDVYTTAAAPSTIANCENGGSLHLGVRYYDSSNNPMTASNGYDANGYAFCIPLNQWTEQRWSFGSRQVDKVSMRVNTNTTYAKPPVTYAIMYVTHRGEGDRQWVEIRNLQEDGSGVVETKQARGRQTVDYFHDSTNTTWDVKSDWRTPGVDGHNVNTWSRIFTSSAKAWGTIYMRDAAGNETVRHYCNNLSNKAATGDYAPVACE